MAFASSRPYFEAAASAFEPPQHIKVSDGAANALVIRQPGGYSGPWSATETPYMVEPMNMLSSRNHEAVCFVGAARSGKTLGLLDGWFAHAVVYDPGDMLVVQMTQDKAREYSKVRVDRAIRHSPLIRERMSAQGHDDNTHDKLTKSGMWLKIGWPSATQLASSDYRYVALTDYDRMPDNVDGEGAPFGLALKRTQTFLSRGMCMVESSPGRDYEDPHWSGSTLHEAPPASGILGIYNRSDRRRWYWQCPDCSEYFEAAPGLALFATLPPEAELLEIVRTADLGALAKQHAHVCCPHCGSQIASKWKPHLNRIETARWVPDGMTVDTGGNLQGVYPSSSIAGFWLGGVAATYQSWSSILQRYLQGLREYVLSGSDLSLKTTTNTDQAMPYLPRHLAEDAATSGFRRVEDIPRYMVPEWARFLVAAVDVQAGRRSGFVVQVHAIGPDLEQAIVDRYNITTSDTAERQLDPGSYPEDWDVLTDKVVKATYKVGEDRELRIFAVGVDTGGEKGVTPQAYAWHQRLRKQGLGEHVYLLKGVGGKPRYPVTATQGRDARGRKVPSVRLYSVQTDAFKDRIEASMRRTLPGPNYMHFPSWLPSSFFDELKSEVRGRDGKWRAVSSHAHNEAFDLWVYVLAVCYILGPANPQRAFDWINSPHWALPLDDNSHVMTREQRRAMKAAIVVPESPRPSQAAVPAQTRQRAKSRSRGFGSDEWASI